MQIRWLAALVLCVWAAIAAAQSPGGGILYVDLDQPARLQVIETLVNEGAYEQAQFLLSNSFFDEGDAGYVAALLQARIFRATGRLAEAEALLAQIVAERPDFAQARFEYAAVLAEGGQRRGAIVQLSRLAQTTGDPASRETLDGLIDTLESRGRPRFQGFAALIEDTNINNGTDATTYRLFGLPFAVAPGARRTSARGLRFGGTMTVDRPLGPGALGYAALRLTFEDFEGRRFDRQIVDLRAGMRRDIAGGRGNIGAELLAERLFRDFSASEGAIGLRAYGRWAVAEDLLISLDATARNRSYDLIPGLLRQERNLTLRVDHLLDRQGWSVWAAVGILDETADSAPSTGFGGHQVDLGVTGTFGDAFAGSLGVKQIWRDFDAVFPGQPAPRSDRVTEIALTFWSPGVSIRGLQPRMSLIWTDQRSNVTLHDFDRLQGSVFLTRQF